MSPTPKRPGPRCRRPLAAGAAVVLGLAGCAVRVDDPQLSGVAAEVCAAVMARLPGTVAGAERRPVRPGERSAAWGQPAITLRCGVPQPAALTRTSACNVVNDIGWFAERGDGGWLFTTIGREVFVEVGVPTAYSPAADALIDLSAAVAEDPQVTPCG